MHFYYPKTPAHSIVATVNKGKANWPTLLNCHIVILQWHLFSKRFGFHFFDVRLIRFMMPPGCAKIPTEFGVDPQTRVTWSQT